MTTLFHVSDYHANCLKTSESWYQDKANGTNFYKPNGALPVDVRSAILPIYNHLTKHEMLIKCLHGKTQNANDCFNGKIWQRIPIMYCWSGQIAIGCICCHCQLQLGVYVAIANCNWVYMLPLPIAIGCICCHCQLQLGVYVAIANCNWVYMLPLPIAIGCICCHCQLQLGVYVAIANCNWVYMLPLPIAIGCI